VDVIEDAPCPRLVVTWLPAAGAGSDAMARLVAEFAGAAPREVRVVRACRSCGSDRHGKPQVVMPDDHPPHHVSLSRSDAHAVVAVTDAGPVGVDVEALTPGIDIVTWARMESIVKATGHGLMIDPGDVDVTPPDAPPALLRWPASEPLSTTVWMTDVDAPDGYVAAATVLTTVLPRLTTRAAPGG
jgi:4'-phosphopantetheinyl transferase